MCATLAETVSLLQESIYTEAANIFGHLQSKKRNLAGEGPRTKLFIQLIQQNNLLLAQIKSAFLAEQQAALTQLLITIKCRIPSFRKAEKARNSRWLIKRTKTEFNVNPYKAGKNLLHSKCYCSLNVDQETLYQHKSSNLVDKTYDVPLSNLENLPPKPSLLKKVKKNYFSDNDFSAILLIQRNASAPGLNGIPLKLYKKCSKISKISFQNFSNLILKM